MAINLFNKYGSRANPPSIDYPQGSVKNRTAPDVKDGTPLDADWANDHQGFFQSILSYFGVTANGTPDKVGASQYFDALMSDPSESKRGMPLAATNAEVAAGTNNGKMVTPASLASRTATDARTGLVELATNAEVAAGTDTSRAVTPAGLAARTATESRTGLLEIATQAEVNAGTDDSRAITPKKLKDGGLWPLGVSQSWKDMTTQRALGTTYTNNTGRAICVSVFVDCITQNSRVRISVDGAAVNLQEVQGSSSTSSTTKALGVSAIVPNGSTYSVTHTTTTSGGSGTPSVELWMELR